MFPSIVIEIIVLFAKLFFYYLEALYRLFVPRSSKTVTGEVVLVTGGGHGIGRELAIEFADRGAKVVVWDINKANNDATVDEIKNRGKSAWGYVCDVTKSDNIHQVAEQVRKDVGEVSILVNNAGILNGLDILKLEEAQIRRCLEVNEISHFWTLREFLPHMMEINHGHVVCIASMAAVSGSSFLTDYSASKFAVLGLMEALREELDRLGKPGIHTTTVCPMFVNTGMTWFPRDRFGRVLEPQEVAKVAMEDMLRNERIVFVPRHFFFGFAIGRLFPRRFNDDFKKFLGIYIDPQIRDNKMD